MSDSAFSSRRSSLLSLWTRSSPWKSNCLRSDTITTPQLEVGRKHINHSWIPIKGVGADRRWILRPCSATPLPKCFLQSTIKLALLVDSILTLEKQLSPLGYNYHIKGVGADRRWILRPCSATPLVPTMSDSSEASDSAETNAMIEGVSLRISLIELKYTLVGAEIEYGHSR
jgi:hypothetical protein